MGDLTAVIPIASTLQNLENLKHNVAEAIELEFALILVIDEFTFGENRELTKFCGEYSNMFPSVKVVKGSFGSPGKARKAGFNQVSTSYVTFWDADDIAYASNIQSSLRDVDSTIDYIVGSYEIFDVDKSSTIKVNSFGFPKKLKLATEPAIWRIVFKTKSLAGVAFGKSLMGEDQVFLMSSGIFDSGNIYFSSQSFYKYFTNLSGQLTSRNRLNGHILLSVRELMTQMRNANIPGRYFGSVIFVKLWVTLLKRIIKGRS